MKKILSAFLVMLFVVMCAPIQVSAAQTFKDKINAMELTPMRKTWPFLDVDGKALIKSVDSAVNGKTTNYDKLLALYNSVVKDADLNAMRKKGNNCAAYARVLYEKMVVLGFNPYSLRGNITAVSGGWTAHSWIGLDVGDTLYFLDPFMSASGGKDYFMKPMKSATMYDIKRTDIWQCDVGSGFVADAVALTKADTAAKRKKYSPVLDLYVETNWVYEQYKSQFEKGGTFENSEYFTTEDKRGRVLSIYRDGTMVIETKAEYEARVDREFQARDREEARRQWNANKEWVDKWGTYDEVFDENGDMRKMI